MDIMGRLRDSDMSFVIDKNVLRYLLIENSSQKSIKFKKEFILTDLDLVKVLHGLLEFNPYFRVPCS